MPFRVILRYVMCALLLLGALGCEDSDTLIILTEQLPNGRVGEPYSFTLEIEGDADEFELVSGTLPPNISFSLTDGEFSGEPTQAGSFTFTIEAIDLARDGEVKDRTAKGFVLIIDE